MSETQALLSGSTQCLGDRHLVLLCNKKLSVDFVLLGTPIWVKGKLSRSHACWEEAEANVSRGAWKGGPGPGKAKTPGLSGLTL